MDRSGAGDVQQRVVNSKGDGLGDDMAQGKLEPALDLGSGLG